MATSRPLLARHERDGSVPTILEAFPVPPSHIPSIPANPPPSRPPSLPLPPVPGPSRISEHDLVLLSSANSRHSSSGSSTGPRRLSNASARYPRDERLTRLAISPVPLSDDDYIATSPLQVLRAARRHRPSDSISSIDMRDLPAVTDEDEPVVPPFNAFKTLSNSDVSTKRHNVLTITVPARASHDILAVDTALADPIDPHAITITKPHDLDPIRPPLMASPPLPSPRILSPQQLHREIRAARSKSPSHKQALRARSPEDSLPPLPHSAPPTRENNISPSPFPTSEPRSSSPDIDSIISATPRPARSLRKHPSSEWTANTRSSFASSVASSSRRARAKELDEEEKQPDPESAGEGGESDDSSIDLHTPLPHLMVKHGLLSPHSKLLPQERGAPTPSPVPDGRPGSTMSMVTKSGVIKDERDTPMRKERHRDGKLLRGGLGLTTGLGWSDSEDEDAPSPLTRRLSSLNLSRRESAASIRSVPHRGDRSRRATTASTTTGARSASASARSSVAHPLARSYSGGATYLDVVEDVDEFGQRVEVTRPRTISASKVKNAGGPPTSWHGRPKISTSASPSLRPKSRISSSNDTNRISNTSNSDDTAGTPSSASSSLMSISLPQTPQDNELGGVVLQASISRKDSRVQVQTWDKDKVLPPIPLQPILKKQPSSSKIVPPGSRSRAGSMSNSTSISRPVTPGARSSTPGPVRPLQLPQRYATPSSVAADRPPVPVPSIPAQALRNSASHGGLQTPPAPSLMPSRSVPGLSAAKSAAAAGAMSVPSSPITGPPSLLPKVNAGVKPKPRTGTGMMYKRSTSVVSICSNAGLAGIGSGVGIGGGTRMRAPVPLVSASLASVVVKDEDVGASGVKGVSSGLAMRAAVARAKVPRLTIGTGGGTVPGVGGGGVSVGVIPPSTPTTPIGQAF